MARLEFFRKSFALGLGILLAFAWGSGAHAETINMDTEGMAKIDLNVQNSSITSVLRTFAEFANVNIVPGPEVEGKVTAKIEEVPDSNPGKGFSLSMLVADIMPMPGAYPLRQAVRFAPLAGGGGGGPGGGPKGG